MPVYCSLYVLIFIILDVGLSEEWRLHVASLEKEEADTPIGDALKAKLRGFLRVTITRKDAFLAIKRPMCT